MKRSGPKLLTSHAGSLPRTDAFIEQNRLRAEGGVDEGSFQAELTAEVGRERVIASTDCGLGGRVHPQIAWAKLESLAHGAALA